MVSVSVVIPTYNRCKTLQRALDSVLLQSHMPDEVIVIDDGSNDNTSTMINTKFPNVQYYIQSNKGVSCARNAGISKAKGDWIAFLDSDDEWLPDKLKMQQSALAKEAEMKICHTEEIWIRNDKRVNPMNKHKKKGGWIFQHCLPLCVMSPSSILIHRTIFDDVGLFDESLPACEDYDLWLRITAKYPVLFIDQAQIIKYGGHDGQLSAKFWGMDRFRIVALEKIIANTSLQSTDKAAAIKVLLKKCRIFRQGAIKRNKQHEAEYYQDIIERFTEHE